jgi:FkbM family methyltransferase
VSALTALRRAFYNAGGPWYRNRLFERLGSERYAQPALHGMDARLDELLGRTGGVFFEAGAHDGFTQSNTYFLERHRGWSGVLVEAIPELHRKAARRRPRSKVFQAALVAPEDAGSTVTLQFGDLQSGSSAEHAVGGLLNAGRAAYSVDAPARTISDVLDEAGVARLDLLVLDIEGAELAALRGLDRSRHEVEVLVIEMLDMPSQRDAFDAFLADTHEPAGTLSPDDAVYRIRADAAGGGATAAAAAPG